MQKGITYKIKIESENLFFYLQKKKEPWLTEEDAIAGWNRFKEKGLEMGVDHIVRYRQDDEKIAEPSSLIKWNNGNVTILRP